jgi:hypothetical protein
MNNDLRSIPPKTISEIPNVASMLGKLGYTELGQNSLGEKSLASYAAGDQALFIRSERYLSRIEGN